MPHFGHDGFEDDAPEPHEGIGKLIEDDVKEGQYAFRWISKTRDEDFVSPDLAETNWSDYDYLCMWIRVDNPGGRINLHAITEFKPQFPVQFSGYVILSWKGWKRVRLPLRGNKSTFAQDGKAVWSYIEELRFEKEEGCMLDLVLDGLCLERTRPRDHEWLSGEDGIVHGWKDDGMHLGRAHARRQLIDVAVAFAR